MWHEEEENSTEKDAETYGHESTQSPIKEVLRYHLLAGLTGGIAPVPPTEALQTSRAGRPWHRTIGYFAAFVHDLIPSKDPLLSIL